MFKSLLLSAVILAASGIVAQAQNPTAGGPTPQAPAAVPLDGGASLLAAAGVAYGLRYRHQRV